MTVITFVSIKGAPGVTTLACLVGATWPSHRRVAVVEADPFGGDLAARFQLSTAWGWSSFVVASRRSQGSVPIDPHFQPLPGGLDVLVRPGGGQRVVTAQAVEALLRSSRSSEHEPWDLVVDGGRLLDADTDTDAGAWLDRSELVVVVVRRDPASILGVRERAPALVDRCGDRVRLVVVGRGPHDRAAIEEFTGLSVLGEVPFDLSAAQVAAGGGGSSRQLSRSLLVVSARRLAVALADVGGGKGDGIGGGKGERDGDAHGDALEVSDDESPSVPVRTLASRLARHLGRVLRRGAGGRPTTEQPRDQKPGPPTSAPVSVPVSGEPDPGGPRQEVML
jgi:hypothetical protein